MDLQLPGVHVRANVGYSVAQQFVLVLSGHLNLQHGAGMLYHIYHYASLFPSHSEMKVLKLNYCASPGVHEH